MASEHPENSVRTDALLNDPELRVRRGQIARTLIESRDEQQSKRGERMNECGHSLATMIAIAKDGSGTVVPGRCGHRLCPVCQRVNAGRWFARMAPVIEEERRAGYRISLLTLTIPHELGDDLVLLIDVLLEAWHRFTRTARAQKDDAWHQAQHEKWTRSGRRPSTLHEDGTQAQPVGFRSVVHNYIRSLEITEGKGGGFHPHLHVLAACGFWPHRMIVQLWQRCYRAACEKLAPQWLGREAQIVDIREIKQKDMGGLAEAVGYVMKSSDSVRLTEVELCGIERALFARRTVGASRDWSGLAVLFESVLDDAPSGTVAVVSMREVIDRDDAAAVYWDAVLAALRSAGQWKLLKLAREADSFMRERRETLRARGDWRLARGSP